MFDSQSKQKVEQKTLQELNFLLSDDFAFGDGRRHINRNE